MTSKGFLSSFAAAALWLALAPALAFAQSTIAGVVKDATGAVLPGVTVEAASPVLIEKVRSVTTNGEGRYAIVDIRRGTYSVTFTLPGFNTFRRDGVEILTESTSLGSNVSIAPSLSSDPLSGGTPTSILQPRIIQLCAQIRF